MLFIFIVGFSVNDVQKEFITIEWKLPDEAFLKGFGEGEITFENAKNVNHVNTGDKNCFLSQFILKLVVFFSQFNQCFPVC